MLTDGNLFVLLFRIDREIAQKAQGAGCPWCGGRLHSASYPPRKPRGAAAPLPDDYNERQSFCCARDGCRKRVTPPSVRFLGRKVYLGAVVVVLTVVRHGVTAMRAAKLHALLGVDRRTLERWRRWWTELVPATPWWQATRALLAAPVEVAHLPSALLAQFAADEPRAQVVSLLRLVSPLTTSSAGPAGHLEGAI